MRNKKIAAVALAAVLAVALCGCQSGKNIKLEESNTFYQSSYGKANTDSSNVSNQSSHETADTGSSNVSDDNGSEYDIYITSGEPYKQGVFTTKEYYSEWMNIYCDIPLEMRLDEDLIETIEKLNQAYSEQGQRREMMAMNSDESIQIEIFSVSVAKNGTLEQYVKNHYKEIRDGYKEGSVNGIQISVSGDNFSTYSFLGEQYLLNTLKTENRLDGKIRQVGNTWELFRMKGDYIIHIRCYVQKQNKGVELNSDVELANLLSLFTTYDSHFNPDSTSNNEASNVGDNSNSNNLGNNVTSGNASVNPCANGHTWEAVEITVPLDEYGYGEIRWYHCPLCEESNSSLDGYYTHFDSSHTDKAFREDYFCVTERVTDETIITGYKCSKCGATKQ